MKYCYNLEFYFILGLIYYGPKIRIFGWLVFFFQVFASRKKGSGILRFIYIPGMYALGTWKLVPLGACSAYLGQGDLEVKLERKEIACENQIDYVFDTKFISSFL